MIRVAPTVISLFEVWNTHDSSIYGLLKKCARDRTQALGEVCRKLASEACFSVPKFRLGRLDFHVFRVDVDGSEYGNCEPITAALI